MGEAYFNQFMRSRNPLVIAVEMFVREENMSPVLIPYNKQRHGWTTQIVSQGSWRTGSSKQKSLSDSAAVQSGRAREFYAHVGILARKKEDAKFQQIVNVKYKLESFTYLIGLMISLYDKVNTYQTICKVL